MTPDSFSKYSVFRFNMQSPAYKSCLIQCDLRHREVDQSEIEAFCKDQDFIGWTEVSVKEGLMIEEAMK